MRKGTTYKGRLPETSGPRVEAYVLRSQGKRRCVTCRRVRGILAFSRRNGGRYRRSTCRECASGVFKKYFNANREADNARKCAYHQRMKEQRFTEVLDALGHACACCGESERAFLTVDHINRDGWVDGHSRSGRALWSKIRREGYPKDKYRILCFNCNCGRERDGSGICPHQRKLRAVS